MITFSSCERIENNKLRHNVELLRTRQKDYLDDELFLTCDEKYLILCHTITEGSMNSYYTQIAIFESNANQNILFQMNKSWSPLWTDNFHYLPESEEVICTLTCFDSETKKNPLPTLVINLNSKKTAILSKDIDYMKFEKSQINIIDWKLIEINEDYCKKYKKKYAL